MDTVNGHRASSNQYTSPWNLSLDGTVQSSMTNVLEVIGCLVSANVADPSMYIFVYVRSSPAEPARRSSLFPLPLLAP